jgi:hypothetical protein
MICQKSRILEKEINTGINNLLKNKNPSILITEDLSHSFSYHQPKCVNRKLSAWLRGKLQERVAFKALAEGFRHEQVNCGHEDLSDRVAAMNYLRRFGDETIWRNVPYSQVKTILLDRFHRRLEAGQPATVPGRTLETVEGISSQMPFEISKISQPVEVISQTGRSIRERNKTNTF